MNSGNTERIRRKKVIKKYAVTLFVGTIYYLLCRYTGISIPCPFHYLTGFLCPGCGITTMIIALSQGQIQAAFEANQALFIASPYIIYIVIKEDLDFIKDSTSSHNKAACFLLIYFFIFTIWRNL